MSQVRNRYMNQLLIGEVVFKTCLKKVTKNLKKVVKSLALH